MAHVFCHHIAAHRGGGAEHDEDGDKFFLPEAHSDGEGKKEDAEAHKLDEGRGDGGFRLPHRLVQPEGGAHGDEPERGGQIAQAGNRFFQNGRKGKAEDGPEKACRNAQYDGIGDDSLQRALPESLFGGVFGGRGEGEDHDGHDVIQRHAADDHQRHQPCVPINIRGQRNAQQGRAAPVGGLDEFSPLRLFFQKTGESSTDGDARRGDEKAEGHEAKIPHIPDICGRQIVKDQHGQRHEKHELIHF